MCTWRFRWNSGDGITFEKSVRFHELAHEHHESSEELNKGKIFHCQAHKLNSIEELTKHDIKITGIKIDVENFEYFVLKGGSELLKKHKPVIYSELWDNENRKNTIKLLTQLGYSAQVLENKSLVPWQPNKHTTQNFFFTHKALV